MASFSTFPTLFSILLILTTIAARPDPQDYWKSVTKNQAMPEALQGLIHPEAGREGHFVKNLKNDQNPLFYGYYKGMSQQENGNENQHIVDSVSTRQGPQGYWKSVTKNQPMPEALQGLIHPEAVREGHFVKNLKNDQNPLFYGYYKGMSQQENRNENQHIVDSVSPRQDPQGYWKSVTKNQPMPEALQGLIHPETGREGQFVKNLKSDKNPLFYGYYKGMSRQETGNENHFNKDELKEEKSFDNNSQNEESNNKPTKGEQIEMVTSS